MGLRVVARHSAGRYGGRALAREVAESHRPKHLDAATRLSRTPGASSPSRSACGHGALGVTRGAGAAAAPASERPDWAPTGMSDFAAQWMFGDQQAASAT